MQACSDGQSLSFVQYEIGKKMSPYLMGILLFIQLCMYCACIYTVVHVLCVIRLFNFHTLSTFNIIFSKTCIFRLNGQPTSNSIFHTTYLIAAIVFVCIYNIVM